MCVVPFVLKGNEGVEVVGKVCVAGVSLNPHSAPFLHFKEDGIKTNMAPQGSKQALVDVRVVIV